MPNSRKTFKYCCSDDNFKEARKEKIQGKKPKTEESKKQKNANETKAANKPIRIITSSTTKKDTVKTDTWQDAKWKKRWRNKVLIKVAEGQTYAEILGKIRERFDPASCGITVTRMTDTSKGDVLLLLTEEANKEELATKLHTIDRVNGVVSERKRVIDVRDLDALTITDAVVQGLNAALGQFSDERKVEVLGPYRPSVKKAVITLGEKEADFLLETGHLKFWDSSEEESSSALK